MNDFPQPVLDVDRCPLILAGPVLRGEHNDVTVWSTKAATQVSLQIYKTSDSGQILSDLVATAQANLGGQYLHVVGYHSPFHTRTSSATREIYAYELGFILEGRSLDLAAALHAPTLHQYLSAIFITNDHFFATAIRFKCCPDCPCSCRKPMAGQDSLVILDELLAHQPKFHLPVLSSCF